MERLIKRIEELGWTVYQADENIYELGKFSPEGQDFNICVDSEGSPGYFIHNLFETYSDFDVSYETSLWLGQDGHGQNGAPYDMRDVYNDMAACQAYILELYNKLRLVELDDTAEEL